MSAVYTVIHPRSNSSASNQNPAHFAHLPPSCYTMLHIVTLCNAIRSPQIYSKSRPPQSLHQHESGNKPAIPARRAPSESRASILVRYAPIYSSMRSLKLSRIFGQTLQLFGPQWLCRAIACRPKGVGAGFPRPSAPPKTNRGQGNPAPTIGTCNCPGCLWHCNNKSVIRPFVQFRLDKPSPRMVNYG
jgi:hypothetical protein